MELATGLIGIGAGIAIGFAALGSGIGQGIAASAAVVRRTPSDINDALALVPAEMRSGVHVYLVGKAFFHFALFSKCHDLLLLGDVVAVSRAFQGSSPHPCGFHSVYGI